MSLEKVADLRKVVEQAQSMRARAEGAVETASQAHQQALSKLKAAGVETPEEALKAAAEAREQVKTAIGKIEAALKEAVKRD